MGKSVSPTRDWVHPFRRIEFIIYLSSRKKSSNRIQTMGCSETSFRRMKSAKLKINFLTMTMKLKEAVWTRFNTFRGSLHSWHDLLIGPGERIQDFVMLGSITDCLGIAECQHLFVWIWVSILTECNEQRIGLFFLSNVRNFYRLFLGEFEQKS